jgi:hypothetical protein
MMKSVYAGRPCPPRFFASAMLLAAGLLAAGCSDMLQGPPVAFDAPGVGRVVLTIGSAGRTILPRLDQFAKIELTFRRTDEPGTMPPVLAIDGKAEIVLATGTWEVTAGAYNNEDPPLVAAQAVNTLTRTGDQITGNTHFVLAPVGTGPGTLLYTVSLPQGLALDAAQSRIRIEQDGEALADLDVDGFTGGIHGVSADEAAQTLSLPGGRYAVDILLTNQAGETALYRESVVILPGLLTRIAFEPQAGDFLSPDARAALSVGGTFGRTQRNSSRTVIGAAGGGEVNRTQALSVAGGTETAYFTFAKLRSQTITVGGADAGKANVSTGGTVDGHAADSATAVFAVDTRDLAGTGGDRVFSFSLGENGKTPVAYAVTITLPHLTQIRITTAPTKSLYVQGTPLDIAGMVVEGTWSDGAATAMPVNETDISGFDTSQAGTQTLKVVKNGLTSSNSFTVTIVERGESKLFFDCGSYDKSQNLNPNKFSVVKGRTLVLAPVKWYIPDNAVYEWMVDSVVQLSTTEYLYFSPASTGTYEVTVTAKAEGSQVATAATTVECVEAPQLRPRTGTSKTSSAKVYAYVAPGQFGEYDTGTLYGAGGFGGYTVFAFDHSVERRGVNGEELSVRGNAFVGWSEPGIIWVMQDENRNGQADDTWYELIGSHAAASVRRYAVEYRYAKGIWVDNLGRTGTDTRSANYTIYTGTMLAKYDSVSMWGYADIVGHGRVNLSNAVQMDGSPIALDFIDFVKVQTAIHNTDSGFGEISTEVGIPSDRFMPNPDMLITGSEPSDGIYTYTFTNNSGYDLTITFEGADFALAVGDAVVKTSTEPSVYIEYSGGNVKMTRFAGGAAFADG